MKNIFGSTYLLLISALVIFGASCSDKEPTAPLPEPVPLKMTLNNTDLVMGETLEITFDVVGTEEGKKVMNEDLNIRLSATTDKGAVDRLVFDDFPSTVVMEKGVSTKTIQIPVKKTGLNKERTVEISAFARGYKLSGALQIITVGDFHYSEVAIKNNADNTVKEGQSFVLIASVNTKLKSDLTIKVLPKEGEESRYQNLPNELVIHAGKSSVESEPVFIKKDITTTNDEDLTIQLSITNTSNRYPLKSDIIKINKLDIHKNMGSDIIDERWLYEDADQLFVSSKHEQSVRAWGQTNYVVVNEGDPHPNSGNLLPQGKWKFFRAYEFHKIKGCLARVESNDKTYISEEYPLGFADQNTGAVETAGAVDNAKYAWVTDDGYLRMISLKERTASKNTGISKNFGTSAFYSNKFMRGNANSTQWSSSNIRIYPGMRIETRARIRGADRSGMLPGIWLQGNEQVGGNAEWNRWPDFGEIDVMENNTKHRNPSYRMGVEQTFHIGNREPGTGGRGHFVRTYAVTDLAGRISDFQIYWMEWVDNETVKIGVNGRTTITLTKSAVEAGGGRWPFSDKINDEGLYYILTMMFLHKAEPNYPSMEMSYLTARRMLKSNPNALIPRMEIDWVRFYIDDTYTDHDKPYRKDLILY
ncbi:MAG: DUF5006 domain-containing protein [Bacteroides sp.]|nr:DUF5006 domain-containing protein [Bacteroides sp.]